MVSKSSDYTDIAHGLKLCEPKLNKNTSIGAC